MALAKYQDTIADSATGRPVANVAVQVFDYPSGSPAILYTSEGALSNQPVVTDQNGYFFFWVNPGHYNIKVKIGGIEKQFTDVPIAGSQIAVVPFFYVLSAAEGPVVLPASGDVLVAKAAGDTSADPLHIIPGTAGQTIEGAAQYREGLSIAGETARLVFKSTDNTWYKF